MKALILAAGEGERVKKLVMDRPKTLISLEGAPLLNRVLDILKESGVNEVFIVVGYLGDKIIEEIGDKYGDLKISYVENTDWRKGNLYSLLAAERKLKENFLLMMSDHLYDPQRAIKVIEEMRRELKSSVLLAVDRKKPTEEDTKVLEKDEKILRIGKSVEGNCVDTGLFLCSPKIFPYAERAARKGRGELSDCITEAANARDAEIFDVAISGISDPPFWIDIDTPEDLTKAEEFLISQKGGFINRAKT